ncbi:LamG-like jellyroll fold domain-containing protein [Flavobacterium terrae]|uniref:Por secretion system C-terminal sorting domain-containing protein n=1 Tax=Flavobacterium terrae TaxID=415425 RepID=A0A1M6AS43_9FLAO|nr:choice-of-anchor Q domain-containing protein [Flavobacterium terrae]SHI39290.1 Por secretion system C-terminal sorting domain-containing protein [Flavobacterium terrae]
MKKLLLFIFSIVPFFLLHAQIPTAGLIKDYKFTNGALTSDVMPSLQAGTTTLVPTGSARTIISDRNSEVDKAITLNGDSFVAGGTNAASVNNYTISFWVKTTVNESPKRYIFDQHNTATNPAGFSVALKDGKIYFNGQSSWSSTSVSGNSGVRQVISPVINDGQWHHIVCSLSTNSSFVYGGAFTSYTLVFTYSMFVDNVSVPGDSETDYPAMLTSESHTIRSITPTKQLVIGKSPSGSYLDYQDSIDQIRYYERALSASEIDILYNEDKPKIKLYVNAAATGANNGTTWADAYTNLDAAITAFTSVNEIWVAAGTYKPTGSARTSTFLMKNALKMYGGFNGTETLLSQRNPKLNLTILSGDISGNDNATITNTEPTRQDNTYHVITLKGNIRDVLIDGFTISGGNANGGTLTTGTASAQFYHTRGGAIYVNTYGANDLGSITLKNCILEKNTGSDTAVSSGFFASGVNNQSYRTDFESCIIRNNFSAANAQILIGGASGFGLIANATITNSLFHNNVSASGPSCLYFSASFSNGGTTLGISASVVNSTFANNTGLNGNVVRTDNGSNTYFKNSIIYGNGSNTPFVISGILGGPTLQSTISQGGQISGINSNPLLNSDYTLQSGSPAIDAGNNTLIVAGMPYDLNGNNRIVNSTVDMGAYEYDSALGAEEFAAKNEFKIYPNPFQDSITIDSNNNIKEVNVFTIDGKQIMNSKKSELYLGNLNSGMYIVKIIFDDSTVSVKKIVKK